VTLCLAPVLWLPAVNLPSLDCVLRQTNCSVWMWSPLSRTLSLTQIFPDSNGRDANYALVRPCERGQPEVMCPRRVLMVASLWSLLIPAAQLDGITHQLVFTVGNDEVSNHAQSAVYTWSPTLQQFVLFQVGDALLSETCSQCLCCPV
jgi:hypothetical protein